MKCFVASAVCVVVASGGIAAGMGAVETMTGAPPCLVECATSTTDAQELSLVPIEAQSQENASSLISDAARFRILADDWMDRTEHESSITRAILHPSHIKIVGMDKDVVLPMIFAELRDRGGHWYWALQFLTGVTDIGERGDSLAVVKAKWLEWAREHGKLRI